MNLKHLITRSLLKSAELGAFVSDAFKTDTQRNDSPRVDALEERVMMSASPIAVAAAPEIPPQVDQADAAGDTAGAQQNTAQTVTSIVFIDSAIDDLEQLVDDFSSETSSSVEVVLLDADRDGVEQITEVLSQRSGIESLHIVSHGSHGSIQIGSTLLNSNGLSQYAGDFAKWNMALTGDADLLIYGCDLAATAEGRELVDSISALTGADVAASDDLTGHADLGGDYDFEYEVGFVDTALVFSAEFQANWYGTLETVTVTTLDDVVNGDTSNISNLIANDGGDGISLREAVIASNGTYNIPDTILLGSGVYSLSLSGGGDLGDLEVVSDTEIIGVADGSTVIDASGLGDRVFYVKTNATTFRNLTITGGSTTGFAGGGGVLVAGGAGAILDSVVVSGNTAAIGGGIRASGSLTVTNSTISNNNATIEGGGLALSAGSSTLESVTISGNVATVDGGGLYVASSSGAGHTFQNVTISGNHADSGGGVVSDGGTSNFVHATITENTATAGGGGIFRNSGGLGLEASIIAGNTAATGNEISGFISSGGSNIIGDSAGDSAGGSGYSGSDLLDQTGLALGALADNGGLVQTHELLTGSVGVDPGLASGPVTDGRGYFRNDGDNDIGAFEQGATPNLEEDLVAHFEFEEGSGLDADDSSQNNTGNIVNGGTWVSDSAVGDLALDLSTDAVGNNTFIDVPNSPLYDFGTGDFSISLWYNMSVPTEAVRMIGNIDPAAGDSGFALSALASGEFSLERSDGTGSAIGSGAGTMDGQWHQLTVVIQTDGSVVFYDDGVETTSSFAASTINVNSSDALRIGASSSTEADFEGKLDDVRLYGRALEASEASQLAVGDSQSANTAPAFISLDDTINYTEGGTTPVQLDADVSIFDTELSALNGGSGDFGGSVLTIERAGGANADDNFNRVSTSDLTFSASNFALSGVQKGSYTFGLGTLVLTFDSGATNADVNEVMQSIGYRNLQDDNPPSSIDIEWTFNDGNSGSQGSGDASEATGITTVNITAVDDVASIDLDGNDSGGTTGTGYATTFTVGGFAVPVADVDAIISDPDGFAHSTMTITIADYDGSEDRLFADTTGLPVFFDFNAVSGVATLTELGTATVADFEQALSSIIYTNVSSTPDMSDKTIEFSFGDDVATTTVVMQPAVGTSDENDAPLFGIGAGVETLDSNLGFNDYTRDVVIQADGKIVTVGYHNSGSGASVVITRFNPDGSLDTTFGGGAGFTTMNFGGSNEFGYGVDIQADGKILVTGNTNTSSGDLFLGRLNDDGSVDTGFGTNGYEILNLGFTDSGLSVTSLSNGNVIVAGTSGNDAILYEYTTGVSTFGGGTGYVTYDSGGVDQFNAVAIAGDGSLIAVGRALNSVTGDTELIVRKYDSLGNVDPSFSATLSGFGGTNAVANSVVINGDGTIVVGGNVDQDVFVMKLNANGILHSGFGGGTGYVQMDDGNYESVEELGVQSDGKLVLIGQSDSTSTATVLRLNADGSPDTTFGTSGEVIVPSSFGTSRLFALAINNDQITAVGEMSTATGVESLVVSLEADGSFNNQFSVENGLDGNPTFVEDGPSVVLDADVNVVDEELDALNGGNGNYSGASITIHRSGGANAEDDFGVTSGNGLTAGISSTGGSVNYEILKLGQIIATGSYFQGELTLTFTDADGEIPTSADVDNILRQIVYANTSDDPPASVDLEWTFDDGNTGSQGTGGALDVVGTNTVNITPVNDPPTLDLNGAAVGVDVTHVYDGTSGIFIAPDAVVDDFGQNSLAELAVDIVGLEANSWVTHNGTALAVSGTAANVVITVGGTSIQTTYDGVNTITFADFDNPTNPMDPGIVEQIIQGLTFDNTTSDLENGDFEATFRLTDVDGNDATAVSAGLAIAVNDAPTFHVGDGVESTHAGDSSINNNAKAVVVQPDGKILVVGDASFGSDRDVTVTRYNPDGTLDTTFGGGDGIAAFDFGASLDYGNDLALMDDGKILVTGRTNGTTSNVILGRLNADGSVDTTFGGGDGYVTFDGGGTDVAFTVKALSNGKAVVVGSSGLDALMLQFNADGTLDLGFGGGDGIVISDIGLSDHFNDVAVQSDGKLVAVGLSSFGGVDEWYVQRFNTDGSLDASFGTGGTVNTVFAGYAEARATSIEIADDGSIMVGGVASANGTDVDYAIAKYDSSGVLDSTFGGGDGLVTHDTGTLYANLHDLTLMSDGRILLAGDSDILKIGTLVRFDTDGTIDSTFGTNGELHYTEGSTLNRLTSVTIHNDQIIAVGETSNGVTETLVTSFDLEGNPNDQFSLTNTLDGNPTYVEGTAAVGLDADVQIFDEELSALGGGSGDFGGATLTLERVGGANADDAFSSVGALGFSGSDIYFQGFKKGTFTVSPPGQMQFTFDPGVTNAEVNGIMQAIGYRNLSDAPPASVDIEWTFNDGNGGAQGAGGSLSTVGITTVNIQNAADLQIVAPISETINEDTALVFSGANPVQVFDGISNHDSPMQVSLSVANGTLSLPNLTGITFVEGANSSGSMVIEGLETDLNTALNGLTFTPNAGFNGGDTLTISTSVAANLEGHYTFDGGSANDQSAGTTQNGMFNGNATTATSIVDGTRGEVLSLDGNGDFVQINGLMGEPSDVTLAAWIDATSTDFLGASIISLGQSPAIYLEADGRLTGFYESGATNFVITTTESLLGTGWRHVAVSIDSATQQMTVFVDGSSVGTITANLPIEYDNSPNTIIGRSGDELPGYDFAGQIDEARIYSRALSADEIAALATDQTEVTDSVAITVNAAVNDAPTFNDLDGNVTYVEGSMSAVALDADVTIFDDELSDIDDFGGATLTIERVGGGNSDDNFYFVPLSNLRFVTGNLFELSNVQKGSYSFAGGTLTLTFDAGTTNADVNEVMQSIGYRNFTDAPTPSVDIAWTFTDGNTGAQGSGGDLVATGTTTVNITAVNDAPSLNGLGPNVSYMENAVPIILDNDVIIYDADLQDVDNYGGATLYIGRVGGASAEDVFSNTGLLGPLTEGGPLVYNSVNVGTIGLNSGGELTLVFNGNATHTMVNDVAHAIAYANSSDNPPASVDLVWTFDDQNNSGGQGTGGAEFVSQQMTVDITAVNDAPVLDNSGVLQLTGITEDDLNNVGNSVAEILASGAPVDPITDADGGDPEGIAITTLTGNGTWQFDTGTGWTEVGSVSTTNALLLGESDRLRYVPDGENGETATILFQAWDQTDGVAGTKVDSSSSGGSTAFSDLVEAATTTVSDLNDAPVMNNAGANMLTAIQEDDRNSPGDSIADIITSSGLADGISDVDAIAVEGVAIFNADTTNGRWEYSTDGGTNWIDFGNPSATAALLLSDTAQVRFVPDVDFNGTAFFSYRAWDQTAGTEGGTMVMAGNTGGSGSLSDEIDTAIITVNAVNDAPTFIGTSSGSVTPFINEIHYDNSGTDTGEAIEIAAAAGTDLTGWSLVLYNGQSPSSALVYGTSTLSGIVADQGDGMGTFVVNFPTNGLENGARDGVALVDDAGQVVQLLSWEGVFTAIDGPAAGMTSVDIGVGEVSGTPVGTSMQLTDAGWVTGATDTFGAENTGQDFSLLGQNYPSETVAEDSPLVFSISQGNPITVGDVDANGAPLAMTLQVSNGWLSLGSTTGLSGLSGNGTSVVTFSGTVDDINAALEGLTYRGNPDYFGSDQLILTVDDQGNSGAGGNLSDVANVVIEVTAINDAPTAANNGGVVDEGAYVTLTPGMLQGNDVDDAPADLTYTVSNIANGQFELSGVPGVTVTSFTQAQIDSGLIVFLHDGSQTSTASFDFSLADGGEDGAAPATGTFNFTVTSINDAPDSVSTTSGGTEDNALGIAITGTDVDGTVEGFRIINLPANGTLFTDAGLTNQVTANSVITAGAGGALSLWFEPTANWNGTTSFDFAAIDSDGLEDATPATKTMNFAALNDDPYNTGFTPADVTVTEDILSNVDLSPINVVDLDDASGSLTVRLTSSTGGNLTANTAFPLVTVGSNGTGQITLTGPLGQLSLFLDDPTNIQYLHGTTNTFGNDVDTIHVEVSDNGNTGAGGGSFIDFGEINVDITNVNDAPSSISFSIGAPEDAASVTVVVSGSDVDGNNTVAGYRILSLPSNGTLYSDAALTIPVTVNSVMPGATLIDLFYVPDLNFNGVETFDFTTVDDQGLEDPTPGSVTVNVTPVNDSPVMPVDAAETVAENTLLVGTFSGTDPDGDTLTYSLTGNDAGLFSIDSATGEVTFISAPDADAPADTNADNVYEITVVATENGTVMLSDSQNVTVTVTEVNEHDVTTPTDIDAALNEVNENVAVGTVVGLTANAFDLDSTNNTITYSLIGNPDGLFQIDANTGVVTTAGALDYEVHGATRTIVVEATSSDGTTATEAFTIAISDLQEFDVGEVFDVDASSNAIDEHATIGAAVGITANATDADVTNNSITYQLQDDDGGRFQIDPATGEVTVASDIDFETDGASRNITVRAQSSDGSFTDQVFTIAINDVNEAPTVEITGVVFSVPEGTDTTTGLRIADVVVIDDALGTNALSLSGSDAGVFEIVGNELRLRPGIVLDFESTTRYDVNVEVNDAALGANPNDVVSHTLNVSATDDEAPVIDPGQSFTIVENSSNGTSVGNVVATDVDTTTPLVSWSIVGGNEDGNFAINPSSGLISVADNTNLDFERSASYDLSVVVSDGIQASAPETVTISVLDANDAPVAQNDTYVVEQFEDVTVLNSGVLQNDHDQDGDLLSAALVSEPEHGLLTMNSDGTVTYVSLGSFVGSDFFTYRVSDGTATGNVATVEILVVPAGGPVVPIGSGGPDVGGPDNPNTGSPIIPTTPPTSVSETDDPVETASENAVVEDLSPVTLVDGSSFATETETEAEAEPEFVDVLPSDSFNLELANQLNESRESLEARLKNLKKHGPAGSGGVAYSGSLVTSVPLTVSFSDHTSESSESSDEKLGKIISGTYAVTTASLSVGYVLWIIRGGSLIASFTSALPAWTSMDPLSVVAASGNDDDSEDGESLLEMVDGNSNE